MSSLRRSHHHHTPRHYRRVRLFFFLLAAFATAYLHGPTILTTTRSRRPLMTTSSKEKTNRNENDGETHTHTQKRENDERCWLCVIVNGNGDGGVRVKSGKLYHRFTCVCIIIITFYQDGSDGATAAYARAPRFRLVRGRVRCGLVCTAHKVAPTQRIFSVIITISRTRVTTTASGRRRR